MESLAVKYRPREFDQVCSQSSIVSILTRQLVTSTIKNCYLFCGASGCGKTTIARIFANKINNNCGDPIEIDGASNNGVDNVKEIIASATERSLTGKYKIYIIDECHALTNQAWQAFLKCIEEPPQYTIFIFCTTDPQKIPATILNRVMRFNFNRISSDIICQRLNFISKSEGYSNYEETCDYLSKVCHGGMRDAISLLEKCSSYSNNLTIENTLKALGNYSYDYFFKLINALIEGWEDITLSIINDFYTQGNDLRLFVDQFLSFCLDIDKYALFKSMSMVSLPNNMEDNIKKVINFDNPSRYYGYVVDKLLTLKNMLRNDTDVKSTIEVMLLGICRCS